MSWPPHPTPALTVDVVIRLPDDRIVLVERRHPPSGWALPGGFVEVGETVEAAALREAREETGLLVEDLRLLGVYSRPDRDPRGHTVSIVFAGRARGIPRGGDDARTAAGFLPAELPRLAFDHGMILSDYLSGGGGGPGSGRRPPDC